MVGTQTYSRKFFQDHDATGGLSAKVVVPIVLELIRPRSVVDVGCGAGDWLAVFQQNGVSDVLGIDGDYVDRSILCISKENFKALDVSRPFTMDRTYDLAICLEVAEHLEPEKASDFIESLTRLAPVILFSAAIPLQGGTHHLNEQWPDYWVKIFGARGLVPVDAIRRRIWSNPDVQVWYRQNIILFCTDQVLKGNPALERESRNTNQSMLAIVHPEVYYSTIVRVSPIRRLKKGAIKFRNLLFPSKKM